MRFPYGPIGTETTRKFRNLINKNFVDVETDFKEVQQDYNNKINEQKNRVDTLIRENPQPSELVDARGGFSLLRYRLDDMLSSILQLFKRNNGIISISEFTSSTDITDTKAFKDAIDYCINIANTKGIQYVPVVLVPADKIYIIDDMLVKPLFVKFVAVGMTTIFFTGPSVYMHHQNPLEVITYKDALKLTQMLFNTGDSGVLGQFIIKGLGKDKGQTLFRIGEGAVQSYHNTHTAWAEFSGIRAEQFGVGFSFTQKQTYIMRFINIVLSAVGMAIRDEGNTDNSGEQIIWEGFFLHNSDAFLEINSEINHTFKGGSIDYNKRGAVIKGKHWNTQIFEKLWVEASNTPEVTPFVEAAADGISSYNNVVIDTCNMMPKDQLADTLFKGPMTLALRGPIININRYQSKNIGAGMLLCDDSVEISEYTGAMFQGNTTAISRKLALNRNSDLSADSVGATTFSGYERMDFVGACEVKLAQKDGYKALRVVAGTGDYSDIITELIPLQSAYKVYGQAKIWLSKQYCKANIVTYLEFYAADKTTLLESRRQTQFMDYRSTGDGNRWFALLDGTSPQPYMIPHLAQFAKFRITVGDVQAEDVYLRDIMLTRI